MKIVFFGTPEYVVPVVKALHKTLKSSTENKSSVVAVVTQEPKPVGRKKVLSHSPVDKWAYGKGIPIFTDSNELFESGLNPDIGVLASFGQIIPKKILNYFPHGILNIHPSLLPKYRGASPVRSTIASGEKEAGATIIKLDEKLDHGKIVSQFKIDLEDKDTSEILREKLFNQSIDVLCSLIKPYLEDKIHLKTQNEKEATYTTQITKPEAHIQPKFIKSALGGKTIKEKMEIPFIKVGAEKKALQVSVTPETIDGFIRAMLPWPTAWTTVKTDSKSKPIRLRILKAHISDYVLVLDEVQLEGRNIVTWKQLKEGYPTVMFL